MFLDRSNPVQVRPSHFTGLSGVVAISAGSYHTVYLKSGWRTSGAGKNNVDLFERQHEH